MNLHIVQRFQTIPFHQDHTPVFIYFLLLTTLLLMTKNVNKQNNKRDNLGRTLSNVITSIPLADFQLTNVDVLEQDLENGFNPIHQSLNSGYIHKAFLLNEAFKKKYKPNSKNGKSFPPATISMDKTTKHLGNSETMIMKHLWNSTTTSTFT